MLEFTFTTPQEKFQGTGANIAHCLFQANQLCQAHYWRLTTIWELTQKEWRGIIRHYTAHTKRPKTALFIAKQDRVTRHKGEQCLTPSTK